MAHNISMVSGRAEVVGQRGTLWHGLGLEVDRAMTTDEAFEKGGLDYIVEPRALKLPDGTFVPDVVANVRITPEGDHYLGCVSTAYAIIPQLTMKEAMDLIVGESAGSVLGKPAVCTSAGVLQGGRKSWIAAKLPKEHRVMKDHVLNQYLVAFNSHDGSMAFRILFTGVNVVCNNTFAGAVSGAGETGLKIHHANGDIRRAMKLLQDGKASDLLYGHAEDAGEAHLGVDRSASKAERQEAPNVTKHMEARVKDAARVVRQAVEGFDEICEASSLLGKSKASDDEIKAYFRMLYPDVRKKAHVLDRQPTRDALLAYYNTGPGAEIALGTWWGAFNAVTFHETYGRWEGGRVMNERRFQISEMGEGRSRKAHALDLALELANG